MVISAAESAKSSHSLKYTFVVLQIPHGNSSGAYILILEFEQ